MKKRVPVGIENFKEIIEENYYYVDKTYLIKDILDKGGKNNLFTRPRRFGKTLNMSMLRYFFEKPIDGVSNKSLFDGLHIASAGGRYVAEQEKYPVISMTLKSAKQPNFEMAYESLVDEIVNEFQRHSYVYDSGVLNKEMQGKFERLMLREANNTEYARALEFLSVCLCQYHQKPVIILIDEYDVPLENSYFAGFYDEMIAFIRSLFESALKTNDNLYFAVITGCLRISKESIFTGLNNLRVNSITTAEFSEYYGFEENEVFDMLEYYDRTEKKDTMKQWYNGYLFGKTEVYNPWSVINYMRDLLADEDAFPLANWANTSSNSIVRDLIYHADDITRKDIQTLVDGGTIRKQIHEDITYDDIHSSQDNLWNFLFFTGYLKPRNIEFEANERYANLTIPNTEVLTIYTNQIQNWFRDELKIRDISPLYQAMTTADAEVFQEELHKLLLSTISYLDSQEAFYHGFLLGVLANIKGYGVKSNREAGLGRYDIVVYDDDIKKRPVVIELKVAKKFREMEAAAETALQQIIDRQYPIAFAEDGYQEVICYGIGFFRKQLRVTMETVNIEKYI